MVRTRSESILYVARRSGLGRPPLPNDMIHSPSLASFSPLLRPPFRAPSLLLQEEEEGLHLRRLLPYFMLASKQEGEGKMAYLAPLTQQCSKMEKVPVCSWDEQVE